jgi:hypothetical protein
VVTVSNPPFPCERVSAAATVGAVVNATVRVLSVAPATSARTHVASVEAKVTMDGSTVSSTPFVNETRTGPIDDVPVLSAAKAGTVDTRPNPIADTATSAMRLRSVFVDICFLSISQNQEFPDLGFG